MSIEFIGMIQTRKVSEMHAAQGPVAFQSLLEGLVEAEPDVHS